MGLSLGRVKQIAIIVLFVASPVTDSNKEQEQRVVGSESETIVSDWKDIYTRGLLS